MGFEFLVVIGTVFMLPFVAAGFVAFCAMNDRERTSLEGTWELYAARRVRELVPARGEWPNRSLPCVRWRKDGVRFELSVVGREAMARTRLVGQARGDRGPEHSTDGLVARPRAVHGGDELPVALEPIADESFELGERLGDGREVTRGRPRGRTARGVELRREDRSVERDREAALPDPVPFRLLEDALSHAALAPADEVGARGGHDFHVVATGNRTPLHGVEFSNDNDRSRRPDLFPHPCRQITTYSDAAY